MVVFLCLIIFSVFFYFINPITLNQNSGTVLGIVSFLFGFYIVFSISNAKSQHDAVIEHLANSDGYLISIQAFCRAFNTSDRSKVTNSIDDYLIATIDYKLNDYRMSHSKALELLNVLQNVSAKNAKQLSAQEDATDVVEQLLSDRVKIETILQDRMSKLEWCIIIALCLVMLFFVYTIKLDVYLLFESFLKAVIATSIVMLLFILMLFDSYQWNKNNLVWERLINTFVNLGLLPYVPDFLAKNKESISTTKSKIRLVHYPHPYPDFSDKSVEIISMPINN